MEWGGWFLGSSALTIISRELPSLLAPAALVRGLNTTSGKVIVDPPALDVCLHMIIRFITC